jgi:nickel-dependent lactate racemase
MMGITLAYGKTGLEIDLPGSVAYDLFEPKYVPGCQDEAGAVREALRRPIASLPLRERVKRDDRVGIIFSDITRPTPYHIILPALLGELADLPDENIVFFNATGTHRANTPGELEGMLGADIAGRFRIVQNDAEDRDSHVRVGTTKSGNQVWLQREFMDCSVKILTGFIEPHFFAGFSGGGKAVMPGLALGETIFRNHSARNMDDSRAGWGLTRGNPLWEEVQEAAAMAEPTFIVNVTLNRDKQITRVFAGDFAEAYRAGCEFAKDTAMAPAGRLYDIVISSNSGYPLDLNLYQSVKGMSAAAQIVRPGGSIIMAADCWDGIPDHGEYGRLLREAASPEDLLARIRGEGFVCQDMWQAQIQALISLKAQVYFHTGNLSDRQLRECLLEPCPRIERTVAALLEKYGPGAAVAVLPEGPQTIPYLAGT